MLWEMVANIELTIGTEDNITWKFIKDGTYSASSAYKMQIEIHGLKDLDAF
jgi:hypothetical protein